MDLLQTNPNLINEENRDKRIFYTIYQITNMLNEMICIGQHRTTYLNDGYMSSCKHCVNAVAKYGLENFKKEYIHIFDNFEEMDAKEREIVNKEFVARKDTYNEIVGGYGMTEERTKKVVEKLKGKTIPLEQRIKISKTLIGKINVNKDGKVLLIKKDKLEDYLKDGWIRGNGFKFNEEQRKRLSDSHKGLQLSLESKKKLSESCRKSMIGLMAGEKNPNFGKKLTEESKNKMRQSHLKKCWVQNKFHESKHILKEELEKYLLDGWVKGRFLSEETLKKKSTNMKIYWDSLKERRKMSEESKIKMSESAKNRPKRKWSEERRKKFIENKERN